MRLKEPFKNLNIGLSFLLEFLLFLVLLFLAHLLREKPPKLDYKNLNFSLSEKPHKVSSQPNEEISLKASQKLKPTYAFLKRNPFSPEGSFLTTPVPENPYTLVAIKTTPEKEAILRFFNGELIKVKEGSTLPEGSKVVKINPNSVILKRLNKERELKIFQVEVEKWRPKRPFGSSSH